MNDQQAATYVRNHLRASTSCPSHTPAHVSETCRLTVRHSIDGLHTR
jgi:hypothetical protein